MGMKSTIKLFLNIFLVSGMLFLGAANVLAEDPLEVGPDVYKLRFENERVRVMEITFAPGAKIDMHSHPDHIACFLTDGKLVLSYPDGTTKDMEGKAGDAAWIPAEAHGALNPGTTEVKGLVIELKEPAPIKNSDVIQE
jgi:quercetin dioxygenase-like cupin family protein